MGLIKFLKDKFTKKKDENSLSLSAKKDDSLDKYDKGLEKSRKQFSNKLDELTKKYKLVNEDYFEELEEILIEADCGVSFTLNIIDELLEDSKNKKIVSPREINELLVDKMFLNYLKEGEDIKNELTFDNLPQVLLMTGVNGVGKTTSIAKLAKRYQDQGKKVLLVAADTFRAGAKEQIQVWGDRLNIPVVSGNENEDPASVAYKGVKKGVEENFDLVIVDTAGRLQNKKNLMDELKKIYNVTKKLINHEPESFLVIDATTGQNGVLQAKAFKELVNITGIVITKMDGTSKGGIILAIREELGIPVRFIGLGEKYTDLEEFDLDKYLYGLCSGLIKDE
ncbi:MAG: signal recognition particle-docking protein FtsY [Candidatus Onthovivens sp.]|nr:signal recognition particle-docking protein FtsY [Candidatus Onthovivens sp.]